MGKLVGKIFAAQQTPASDGLSLNAATRESAVGNFEPSPEKTPEKVRCEICGKEYKTEKGLAEHRQREHPLDLMPDAEPGEN